MLPHVNWGDLFFDLFYVAAAYNLAAILKYDSSFWSIFYFFACFGPVYSNFWNVKTIQDARFSVPNDVVHTTLDVLHLSALATAVLHIQPVARMSHPVKYYDTFMFCLANLAGSMHGLLYSGEIAFIWVDGDDSAKHQGVKDVKHSLVTVCFNVASTVYAGFLHYSEHYDGNPVNHGPMIIMWVSWLSKPAATYLFYVVLAGGTDFKKFSVPINIDFVIHRIGEWTMLMLGESILSLLIVNDVHHKAQVEYYTTFYVGIVSVTLLQVLYFRTQPHSADHHAMRRTRKSGIAFNYFIQFYSAALIVVGASYNMLLSEYTEKYFNDAEDKNEDYERWLAESSSTKDGVSTKERREVISRRFGLGLFFTFICLECLTLCHAGFVSRKSRFHDDDGNLRIKHMLVVIFGRAFTAIFCGTYWLWWNPEPYVDAIIGLSAILVQVSVQYMSP